MTSDELESAFRDLRAEDYRWLILADSAGVTPQGRVSLDCSPRLLGWFRNRESENICKGFPGPAAMTRCGFEHRIRERKPADNSPDPLECRVLNMCFAGPPS